MIRSSNVRTAAARQRGVTLIESAVATSIIAIAAGAAVPGFSAVKGRHQVIGAAGAFGTDVQLARSTAVMHNAAVRITFGDVGGARCYVVHTGSAADCGCAADGAPQCRPGVQVLRSESFASGRGVALASNVRSILFDPVRGTSTPAGTVRFVGTNGAALHQVVNIMGRVRTCSPGSSVPGHIAC